MKLQIRYSQNDTGFMASGYIKLAYYPFAKNFLGQGNTPCLAEADLLDKVKYWKKREQSLPPDKEIDI